MKEQIFKDVQVEYFKEDNIFRCGNIELICPYDLVKQQSKDFELYLFKNLHLNNAQKDIWNIRIKEEGLDEQTCGLLFPITRLEVSEDELSDTIISDKTKSIRNEYKYVAYELLLKKFFKRANNTQNPKRISEIFPDVYILILYKKFFKEDSNIFNYLPSLYKLGFLYIESDNLDARIPELHHLDIISNDDLKKQNNILLKKTCSDISKNNYIKNLFSRDLVFVDNCLARFMMLYQIIEIYIEDRLEYDAQKYLDMYKRKQCNFNDFREQINNLQKERSRVTNLFQTLANETDNFNSECKKLNIVFNEKDTSFGSKLYSLRNKLVHGYHLINSPQNLENLIIDIESVVIELLITKPICFKEYIEKTAYFLSLTNNLCCEDNWYIAETNCSKFK